MQPAQLQHLQKLINESKILSGPERAEWLDMLILMNDKQASELETILMSGIPGTPPPKVSPPAHLPVAEDSPGASRPLSHISNLPAGVNTPSRPVMPPPKPQPLAPDQFRMRLQEKELPAPPSPPQPKPPSRSVQPTQPLPRSIPQPHSSGRKVPLENLSDVSKLTVNALRSYDAADLLLRLQQLSKMEGYFNLLAYLEDSPLYKNYIATGKKILLAQMQFPPSGDDQTLGKEEFELFADILQKIQLN